MTFDTFEIRPNTSSTAVDCIVPSLNTKLQLFNSSTPSCANLIVLVLAPRVMLASVSMNNSLPDDEITLELATFAMLVLPVGYSK